MRLRQGRRTFLRPADRRKAVGAAWRQRHPLGLGRRLRQGKEFRNERTCRRRRRRRRRCRLLRWGREQGRGMRQKAAQAQAQHPRPRRLHKPPHSRRLLHKRLHRRRASFRGCGPSLSATGAWLTCLRPSRRRVEALPEGQRPPPKPSRSHRPRRRPRRRQRRRRRMIATTATTTIPTLIPTPILTRTVTTGTATDE